MASIIARGSVIAVIVGLVVLFVESLESFGMWETIFFNLINLIGYFFVSSFCGNHL